MANEKDIAENQEGKSLDQLAGEGQIADDETIEDKLSGEDSVIKGEEAPNGVRGERAKETVVAAMTEEEIMKPVDFKEGCFGMRADIELIKSKCKNWMSHPEFEIIEASFEPFDKYHEMKENIELAYRHLEDARMRIGKAIQAFDSGKSCYPR